MQGCVPRLRTDDLQQKPARTRESEPICVGSREPRARRKQSPALGSRADASRQGSHMQILSARHVKPEESARLGVVSGWYSTKVSGTFVTGPHTTQEDCLSKILELNPPPVKKKFPIPG
jgi:hypothetical protein